MGFLLKPEVFDGVLKELGQTYRLYAPVRKKGEGRYTDVDVVRYDFVQSAGEIELEAKSDYAFKEFLTPLSQTLFFFTENEVKEALEAVGLTIVEINYQGEWVNITARK